MAIGPPKPELLLPPDCRPGTHEARGALVARAGGDRPTRGREVLKLGDLRARTAAPEAYLLSVTAATERPKKIVPEPDHSARSRCPGRRHPASVGVTRTSTPAKVNAPTRALRLPHAQAARPADGHDHELERSVTAAACGPAARNRGGPRLGPAAAEGPSSGTGGARPGGPADIVVTAPARSNMVCRRASGLVPGRVTPSGTTNLKCRKALDPLD